MSPMTWSDECMLCGGLALDASEVERRLDDVNGMDLGYHEAPPGRAVVDILWVYCRACDCWTEHPPEPAAPLPSSAPSDQT